MNKMAKLTLIAIIRAIEARYSVISEVRRDAFVGIGTPTKITDAIQIESAIATIGLRVSVPLTPDNRFLVSINTIYEDGHTSHSEFDAADGDLLERVFNHLDKIAQLRPLPRSEDYYG